MPAPYSQDLRQKVIEAVENGQSQSKVSRNFGINRNTIGEWLKRRKERGSYAAEQGYQKGHNRKIQDLEKFRKLVEANPGKTQGQIAQLWGEGVTQQNVSNAMKKLGMTRKKKRMGIVSEMNRSERNLERNSKLNRVSS